MTLVLSGGCIARLYEGVSVIEKERKRVDPLHHFSGVRNFDLILWINCVVHPRALGQDFCGIEILGQTGDDSASMADQASASFPFSPLSARFDLVDLDVAGDGVDCV